jgi:hypothetical protein
LDLIRESDYEIKIKSKLGRETDYEIKIISYVGRPAFCPPLLEHHTQGDTTQLTLKEY